MEKSLYLSILIFDWQMSFDLALFFCGGNGNRSWQHLFCVSLAIIVHVVDILTWVPPLFISNKSCLCPHLMYLCLWQSSDFSFLLDWSQVTPQLQYAGMMWINKFHVKCTLFITAIDIDKLAATIIKYSSGKWKQICSFCIQGCWVKPAWLMLEFLLVKVMN